MEELTAQQQNVITVLERIIEQVKDEPWDADVYGDALDEMLDDLKNNDFFGSEATTDPRGNQRDGNWTVGNPEP